MWVSFCLGLVTWIYLHSDAKGHIEDRTQYLGLTKLQSGMMTIDINNIHVDQVGGHLTSIV